jgi:hypothetical protein
MSQIGNADGTQLVTVGTIGCENLHITIMLAIKGNDRKIPPSVMFKNCA